MREPQVTDRVDVSAQTDPHHPAQLSSEPLHVRTCDHRRAYDILIELVDDGDGLFKRGHCPLPGRAEIERGVAPTDTCELQVTLENRFHDSMKCHIGPSPGHTTVVEVGDGTVALTQGLVD